MRAVLPGGNLAGDEYNFIDEVERNSSGAVKRWRIQNQIRKIYMYEDSRDHWQKNVPMLSEDRLLNHTSGVQSSCTQTCIMQLCHCSTADTEYEWLASKNQAKQGIEYGSVNNEQGMQDTIIIERSPDNFA